ncbi:MerR family transcriptional regulator [Streptomyces sp. V3I8]|uniref:MerR family transcriptional regulator n=1 Tax=Streptomyces sp. V3I8 TaxID=3042279 RepID=UPI0027D8AA13|nr:MerR family transcriptional regulator [Streptomyces sp. V3I8]
MGVTTGFLARTLGVSPTTLRSWDRRYGLGPAVRADGRQRRWSPQDVAMLREMCRLTATGVPPAEAARAVLERARGESADAPGPPGGTAAHGRDAPAPRAPSVPSAVGGHSPGASGTLPAGIARQECRGLARAAVRLDASAVQEQLTASVRAHGLVAAWEEVMAPTLRAAGRKWESSGDRYVEVEHLLSWHVSTVLRHVYVSSVASRHGQDASPVLLTCLPDEQHTLPLEALNAALAEAGVPTLMLGGAVPVEAVDSAVRRVGPAAVALWSQSRSTANLPLAQHIAATRWGIRGARRQSPVLLCGPGWGRGAPDGLLRPTGLRDAVRMLVSLDASSRP